MQFAADDRSLKVKTGNKKDNLLSAENIFKVLRIFGFEWMIVLL
jgi:hypothetical protein